MKFTFFLNYFPLKNIITHIFLFFPHFLLVVHTSPLAVLLAPLHTVLWTSSLLFKLLVYTHWYRRCPVPADYQTEEWGGCWSDCRGVATEPLLRSHLRPAVPERNKKRFLIVLFHIFLVTLMNPLWGSDPPKCLKWKWKGSMNIKIIL